MINITLHIKPDPKEADIITGLMNAAVAANMAKIKQIQDAVADIRDPNTGAGAQVEWKSENGGIAITISGSKFVKDEAERRISGLPNQPPS